MEPIRRIEYLKRIIDERNLDALVITKPTSITYFTGIRVIGDTIAILYLERGGEPRLYVPVLEYYRFRDLLEPVGIEVYGVSRSLEVERTYKGSMKDLLKEISSKHNRVGADAQASPMGYTILSILGNKLVDVSDDVWAYRSKKTAEEIQLIEEAVAITMKGIETIVDYLHENISDTELAGLFEHRVRIEGVDEISFPPLVLFKPDNSYPHNLPTGKRLKKSDLILIDVGVKFGGYSSDLTRMIVWGSISDEEKKVIEAVVEAVNNVIDKASPGMKGSEIDKIARDTLAKYGFDKYFIHGLGHGIGLDYHEPPYLAPAYDKPIEPGMVFTIEPGVYIPGRFGVRIEEDAMMTKKGIRILSKGLDRVLTP